MPGRDRLPSGCRRELLPEQDLVVQSNAAHSGCDIWGTDPTSGAAAPPAVRWSVGVLAYPTLNSAASICFSAFDLAEHRDEGIVLTNGRGLILIPWPHCQSQRAWPIVGACVRGSVAVRAASRGAPGPAPRSAGSPCQDAAGSAPRVRLTGALSAAK
jgi:hypothetical protein